MGFASVNVVSTTTLSGAGFQGASSIKSLLLHYYSGRTVYATVLGI